MSIKKDILSGVAYTAIAKYAGVFISLGITAILARCFTPEEFGVVNIATVFISFFTLLSDLGIGPAVIQKDLSSKELDGIFCLTLISGLLLSLLFCLFSGWIASFYDNPPMLQTLLQILSLSIFFNSANMVPNALIMKAKRFSFVAYRTLAVQVLCGGIAVVAALKGLGIYALLINPVGSAIVLFVINYLQYPLKPIAPINKALIDKIASFSLYQFLFQFINYFSRNLDKLLMGKYMSMEVLGYYDKAYRLMLLPLQNITYVITPVMHPVFAQIREDKSNIAKSYLKMLGIMAFIGFPLAAGLYFMARNLVLLMFGWQWFESIPAFKILALSVGFQILTSTTGAIFQVADATKQMFYCGLFGAVCTAGAVLIALFSFATAEAVAWAITIAYFLCFVQAFITLFVTTLKIGIKPFLQVLVRPLLLTLIMVIAMEAASWLLDTVFPGISRAGGLCVYLIVWFAVWISYMLIAKEKDVLEVFQYILSKIRRK